MDQIDCDGEDEDENIVELGNSVSYCYEVDELYNGQRCDGFLRARWASEYHSCFGPKKRNPQISTPGGEFFEAKFLYQTFSFLHETPRRRNFCT